MILPGQVPPALGGVIVIPELRPKSKPLFPTNVAPPVKAMPLKLTPSRVLVPDASLIVACCSNSRFRSRAGGTPGAQLNQATGMTDRIRITKQEAVPDSGSFEVRFPDDRPTSVTGSLSSAFSSACSLQ